MREIPLNPYNRLGSGPKTRPPNPSAMPWVVNATYEFRLNLGLTRFTTEDLRYMIECGDNQLAARVIEENRKGRIRHNLVALLADISSRPMELADIGKLQDLRIALTRIAKFHLERAVSTEAESVVVSTSCRERAASLSAGIRWIDEELVRLQREMIQPPNEFDDLEDSRLDRFGE